MDRSSKSPSAMFWDEIETAQLFNSSLWPDSNVEKQNHWFLEPHFLGGLQYPENTSVKDWKPGYFHIDLLNDIRFRNFIIRQSADIDKRYDYDPLYPAHQERSLRGRIEEAYIQANWKYGFFRIGRQKRNWGPFSDRSLFLSTNPYSYDAVEIQLHSSVFEFRHLFAIFPYDRSNRDSDNGTSLNRFLTAHSLNIILGQWATLGISEAVVFTRANGVPDLQYVNPISIYTVVNTNQEGVGNLMLALQWNVHPFTKSVAFKGQVVFDDFQVDDEIVTDNEPTHWGTDMGIFWYNPLPISIRNMAKLEYTYKSAWLYTVPDVNAVNGERYTYLQKSLGAPDNDGYKINLGLSLVANNYWAANIGLFHSRKGGHTVMSRWNDMLPGHTPGLPDTTIYTEEKTFGVSVEPLLYFKNFGNLKVGFSGDFIRNKDNIPTSKYKFSPSFSAELSLHYSNFHLLLPK